MMTTLPAASTTFPIYLWGTPLCLYHAPALEQDFFTICQENIRSYDYFEEILDFWKKYLFSHLRNLAQSAARRSATPSSTTTVSSGRAAWWWLAHRYAIFLCSLDWYIDDVAIFLKSNVKICGSPSCSLLMVIITTVKDLRRTKFSPAWGRAAVGEGQTAVPCHHVPEPRLLYLSSSSLSSSSRKVK